MRLHILALCLLLALCACSQETEKPAEDAAQPLAELPFVEIQQKAIGSTVRFFGWGGDANINRWLDTWVAGELMKRYSITFERVPMDAPVFVNKLLGEKSAGRDTGSMDLLWINGENFRNAKDAGLLYGPYAQVLPNFQKYVDPDMAAFDFGYPTEGYESPYGRAHFVFEYDSARTPNPPKSFGELREWVLNNPGRFTYPQPPDFTGSAFIRQAFYALTGGHEQYMKGWDAQRFADRAPLLWKYLNSMKPSLWQEGRSYPKGPAAQDTLFARGEVDLNMNYNPTHAQRKILEGTYPDTVRTYRMLDGGISNTHFVAIPFNAPNKAGAMVVADFLMSPEAQLSKFDAANWGDFPAIEMERLPDEWREKFDAMDLGPATLSPQELATTAVPEVPAQYLEALEDGWDAEVLHK